MPYAADEYGEAAKPAPYQILGVRLKPLSLDHCITMQRHGVGFTSQAETTGTLEDLIFALIICSKKWEEGEFDDYVISDQCEKDVTEWGEKVGKEITVSDGLPNIDEKIKLFNDYIHYHAQEPAYAQIGGNDGDVSASGAHWAQCILLTLTSHCGYTRQEALHCPLRQALSDYFRYAETQGVVRLIAYTPHERAMMEAADKAAQEVNHAN